MRLIMCLCIFLLPMNAICQEEEISVSPDQNYSRHLFSPSARTLKSGTGYYTNYYVLISSLSYGVIDRLTLNAGFLLPLPLAFYPQMYWAGACVHIWHNENIAVSAGANLFRLNRENYLMGYSNVTMGKSDKCITMGIGLRRYTQWNHVVATDPMVQFGANYRLTKFVTLVADGIYLAGKGVDQDYPNTFVIAAARFQWTRKTFDLGLGLVSVPDRIEDEGGGEKYVEKKGSAGLLYVAFAYSFGH